jgi:protein-tyrosine kinase
MTFIKKALDKHKEDNIANISPRSVKDEEQGCLVQDNEKTIHSLNQSFIEIDIDKLTDNGITLVDGKNKILTEEIRNIKRILLKKAFEQKERIRNVIMVTSAIPGEGKTFISTSLALSVAMELDHSVLLIDADVIRGGLIDMMGLERSVGLTDYLIDNSLDVATVLNKTNIPKLNFISPGTKTTNTAELFASDKMKKLIDHLAKRYDDRLIILDTPPLLATSDASYLANLADQIIVIVDSETTTEQRLNEALSQFDDLSAVSLLLNKRRIPAMVEGYYSYGQDTD